MNSYSYSENNPIVKSDPSGKFAPALAPVAYGLADLGLASTIEFWGPPVLIGAGVAALGVGAYSLYHDKDFTTSIEVNGGTNETDLPNKTPNDPRGKIILGVLGVTTLIGAGEEYFNKAAEAGNQFGGLATYTLMPHPVMVSNLPSGGNGAPINQKSAGLSSGGSSGGGSGSSAALVGLYQSLVATLTALVSALSTGKR
jgi:hypothetical protein